MKGGLCWDMVLLVGDGEEGRAPGGTEARGVDGGAEGCARWS